MTTKALEGRIALVTGSGRGIGKAIALALAGQGAAVAVNYRSREREAREVSDRIRSMGCRSVCVQADISSADDINRLRQTIERNLGLVDILVNNAGVGRPAPIEAVRAGDWDECLAVNLRGPFLLTQALLPGMQAKGWGRIIMISSVAAQTGGVIGPHYAASKAGMIGLMHYYATHLAKQGITANAIAPAAVRSDMLAGLQGLDESRIPVGRFGIPDEVASAAVMLATNGYITGQTVNVNGGMYTS